jgi:hypothetical protein
MGIKKEVCPLETVALCIAPFDHLYPQNLSFPVVCPHKFHPQTRMNTGLQAFFRSD